MMRCGRFFQRGFSLIEVSVATAVYSVGLGGLSMMLMLAVQGTADARYETVAVSEAASLAEMILMNSDAVGDYVNPPSLTPDCTGTGLCTPGEMAGANLGAWSSRLRGELPGGAGLVCYDGTPDDGQSSDAACDGAGGAVIKVFWTEPARPEEGSDGRRRLVSRLPLP